MLLNSACYLEEPDGSDPVDHLGSLRHQEDERKQKDYYDQVSVECVIFHPERHVDVAAFLLCDNPLPLSVCGNPVVVPSEHGHPLFSVVIDVTRQCQCSFLYSSILVFVLIMAVILATIVIVHVPTDRN